MTERAAARRRRARIAALPRPALVAVDGVSAAGKTTFADELVPLGAGGLCVISVDDFHRPAAERHARGEGPETYYHDTFDVQALRRALEGVDAGTVAVVDGMFLLRPGARGRLAALDLPRQCDRATACERGIARDASSSGGEDARVSGTRSRYVPGETRYLEDVDLEALADIVVETPTSTGRGFAGPPDVGVVAC